MVEAAMVTPILLALLIGTVELAKVTYTYYMLQKIMFNLARSLGTQQNVCDADVQAAAINYAVTGTADGSGNPIVSGLTASMVQVTPESQPGSAVDCSSSQAALPPGFLVVSLADGYTVRPLFWGFQFPAFQLRPAVRVPYEGT